MQCNDLHKEAIACELIHILEQSAINRNPIDMGVQSAIITILYSRENSKKITSSEAYLKKHI